MIQGVKVKLNVMFRLCIFIKALYFLLTIIKYLMSKSHSRVTICLLLSRSTPFRSVTDPFYKTGETPEIPSPHKNNASTHVNIYSIKIVHK